MSLTSKIVVITTGLGAVGTILYVHYKQEVDKQKMHDGVIKDIERQQRRKTENLYVLQQQIELGKILKSQANDEDLVLRKLLDSNKETGDRPMVLLFMK